MLLVACPTMVILMNDSYNVEKNTLQEMLNIKNFILGYLPLLFYS